VGVQLLGLPADSERARAGGEVAAAPNTSFIASWHGTMEGEVPGWSGNWAFSPPKVAHFVGGMDKVGAMLALGWWRWQTEVVLANMPRDASGGPLALGAVDAPTLRHFKKGLPNVLALAGPGAAAWHAAFDVSVRAQGARRLWLSVLASLLGRVAVEPVTDCTQPWLVRLNNTAFGYSRRMQRVPREGVFQEVDERSRVGATMGECARGFSPPPPHAQGVCCFPLFDVRAKVRRRHGIAGLPGAHHRLVDAVLGRPGATRMDVEWASLGLPDSGLVDAPQLAASLGPAAVRASVLVLRVPLGFGWPQLVQLGEAARGSLCADLGPRCAEIAPESAPALPVWPPILADALRAAPTRELNPASSVAEWKSDPRAAELLRALSKPPRAARAPVIRGQSG